MKNKYSEFHLRYWELTWCIVIFVFGTIGNIIVLTVLSHSKTVSRKSPFNVYIFALAIVDLVTSCLVVPDYVFRTNIYDPPSGHEGTLLCKFLIGGLMPFTFLAMSVYLLVAICLERRKAVLYPFSTLTRETPLYQSLLVLFLIFCLSVFNQLPTISSIYYNKENATSGNFCAYKDDGSRVLPIVFHLLAFVLECVIPVIIFLVSFCQISRFFSKINSQLILSSAISTRQQLKGENLKDPLMKRKESTIATMRTVVIAFLVCILPNEIVYLAFEFVPFVELKLNAPIVQVTVLMRYSNALLNPMLYSFRSAEFRKNFLQVFKPCWLSYRRALPKMSVTSGFSLYKQFS